MVITCRLAADLISKYGDVKAEVVEYLWDLIVHPANQVRGVLVDIMDNLVSSICLNLTCNLDQCVEFR